ncbi:hypothetical protein GXM_02580 [Nostoc sphaeroides CCNUC1]|uniref:Uncharacterized protein n=1 Tax=Nostoc sphaeroides CCNUC1 TaxID=2653204 RepID=A0A5P8VXH5_9NOSO|nr:hypothetical protein GXM_02580 [Nostoc sphaeroides CCNUC1]
MRIFPGSRFVKNISGVFSLFEFQITYLIWTPVDILLLL